MVEMYIMSMKDRWLRRKYMGVWSHKSVLIRNIMIPLVTSAVKKMTEIMAKRRPEVSCLLNSPMKTKSVDDVLYIFIDPIMVLI
jgi:hypothetical protein